MDIRTAEIIEGWNPDLVLKPQYSGRGMFGTSTSGVIGSYEEFYESIAEIMKDGDEQERNDVSEAIRSLRVDNMGREQFIFY